MLAARGADATISLAGRTLSPAALPLPTRIGGFGGAAGMGQYLEQHGIRALVDATHPYAARISAHAAEAAAAAGVPLLALRRPPWVAQPGDDWTEVADVPAALAALGAAPRQVFLALGRQELHGVAAFPQHRYLVRSVDPILPPLPVPQVQCLLARGPFDAQAEHALLRAHGIEAIIAKNSGGAATYGKIAAARSLGVAVLLLRRPVLPAVTEVASPEAALAWLDHPARLGV